MEDYIILSETERTRLCNELAYLTYQLKQNNHVQCIYFSSYKNLGSVKGNVVNITVVVDSDILIDYNKEYQNIMSQKEQLSRYGLKICFDTSEDSKYVCFPQKRIEREKETDIFNSTILFDRSGKYTKIKKATEKLGEDRYYYYDNRADIYPPLNVDLEIAMNRQKMKSIRK